MFESFVEKSKLKCSLDSNINKSVVLYKISQSDFLSYFKTDIYKGYKELYEKYKDVTGIIEFSRIGYNQDRTSALAEICFYEAPLNSFGLFVWLKYENGKWTVVEEYLDWVS